MHFNCQVKKLHIAPAHDPRMPFKNVKRLFKFLLEKNNFPPGPYTSTLPPTPPKIIKFHKAFGSIKNTLDLCLCLGGHLFVTRTHQSAVDIFGTTAYFFALLTHWSSKPQHQLKAIYGKWCQNSRKWGASYYLQTTLSVEHCHICNGLQWHWPFKKKKRQTEKCHYNV